MTMYDDSHRSHAAWQDRLHREDEWQRLLAQVKVDPDDRYALFKAVQWLLVQIFGSEEQYHTDPVFHAEVKEAAVRIDHLYST